MTSTLRTELDRLSCCMALVFPTWRPFDTIDYVQHFFFRDAKAGSDEFCFR